MRSISLLLIGVSAVTCYQSTTSPHYSVSLPPGTPTRIPCSREGYFEEPTDCTRFYRCVDHGYSNGLKVLYRHEFQCAPGTMFDLYKGECNHYNNAHMSPRCQNQLLWGRVENQYAPTYLTSYNPVTGRTTSGLVGRLPTPGPSSYPTYYQSLANNNQLIAGTPSPTPAAFFRSSSTTPRSYPSPATYYRSPTASTTARSYVVGRPTPPPGYFLRSYSSTTGPILAATPSAAPEYFRSHTYIGPSNKYLPPGNGRPVVITRSFGDDTNTNTINSGGGGSVRQGSSSPSDIQVPAFFVQPQALVGQKEDGTKTLNKIFAKTRYHYSNLPYVQYMVQVPYAKRR